MFVENVGYTNAYFLEAGERVELRLKMPVDRTKVCANLEVLFHPGVSESPAFTASTDGAVGQ